MSRAARGAAAGWLLGACGCTLLPTLGGEPPPLSPPAATIGPAWSGQVVRGVFHCHSERSHDSTGTLEHIAEEARAGGVSFVLLTDHYRRGEVDLHGIPKTPLDGVTFVPGAEFSGGGGSILAVDLPRDFEAKVVRGDAQGAIDAIRKAKGFPVVGHAEEYLAWDAIGWGGLEVANLHAMAKGAPKLGTVLSFLFTPPGTFFRRLIRHLDRAPLRRWDELGARRRIPGLGGCDAHENIHLFGPLGGPTVGTYGECFRAVAIHLLVRQPGTAGLLEALRAGRGYVAFEIAGSALGFDFAGFDPKARVAEMGEAIPLRQGVELRATAPGDATLRLLRNGAVVRTAAGRLAYPVRSAGVYRIEAYLGDDPFVFSNPIYVRAPTPAKAR